MAKIVVKKDGTEEPFDLAKLKESIRVNAIDSALKEVGGRINDIVEQTSQRVVNATEKREKISTGEIRTMILDDLGETAPLVAKIWRQYDEQAGKI